MANSRSARKRIRASERKHVRNRAIRSSVRTKITKARRALLGLEEAVDSAEQLIVAVSALDRAAEKGVIHANNASRRKSRLMLLANRIEQASAGGEDAQSAARAAAVGGEKGRKTSASVRAAAGSKGGSAKAGAKAGSRPAAKAATKPAARPTTKPAAKAVDAKGETAARPARSGKGDKA